MKMRMINKKEELGSIVMEMIENPGSIINRIMENSKLSEEEKNEKMTEILIFTAHHAGRVNRGFWERRAGRLWQDYLRLSAIRRLADHLPEEEKVRVKKEVVNAYMNVVRVYKWKDSHWWVKGAVYTAEEIPGKEGIEILEKLGNEFIRRDWTWSASLVANALERRGEEEKAKKLRIKIDFRKAASDLNKKKGYQPLPPQTDYGP